MLKSLVNIISIVLAIGSFLLQPKLGMAQPSENYYPFTKLTDSGRMRLVIEPQLTPIPLNTLHSWIVKVTTAEGQPVQPLEILIDGGMPRHSHGLPTQPKVTRYLDNGKYQIDGLQFYMEGVWQLHFKCLDEQGWNQVTFNILVGPNKQESMNDKWSDSEISVIKTLLLQSNHELPSDPSNAVADNLEAAKLGQKIFFDPLFSRNQKVSCATCHQPRKYFTDGKQLSEGLLKVSRNAPSLVGVAYNHWFYWDGRRDSLWAQALTPFEAAKEMGFTRVEVLKIIAESSSYSGSYNQLFGPLPDWFKQKNNTGQPASPIGNITEKSTWKAIPPRDKRAINIAFANIGKTMAAYERKLLPAPSLFDRYAKALVNHGNEKAKPLFTKQQLAGMKLFISGKTQCLSCHNGPMLTNQSFHNIGTGSSGEISQDMGRILGIQSVLMDEFNCMGPYNDQRQASCDSLVYINRHEIGALMNGAFKVPSLRNLEYTSPYMHDGRFTSLMEVLKHYQNPPDKAENIHEISKLTLSIEDLENLSAFLKTLSGPVATPSEWLVPPQKPVLTK